MSNVASFIHQQGYSSRPLSPCTQNTLATWLHATLTDWLETKPGTVVIRCSPGARVLHLEDPVPFRVGPTQCIFATARRYASAAAKVECPSTGVEMINGRVVCLELFLQMGILPNAPVSNPPSNKERAPGSHLPTVEPRMRTETTGKRRRPPSP